MKTISLVVLTGLCAVVCGFSVTNFTPKVADTDFLYRQKCIFELFQHIHQNEVFTNLYEQSHTFIFKDYYTYFTKPDVLMDFERFYERGFLAINEIFTIYNEYHRTQAIALFNVFYYARDFETFYKFAVWARFNINEGMFIYAFSAAIFHRHDTVGIELPAIYEIYPYYFFKSETIQQAQNYKMQGFSGFKKIEGVYTAFVEDNFYDNKYYSFNYDQKINYFTEDIGLNAYYYYYNMDYPFWMGGKEFNLYKDRRGENFLFFHQQLLARYYMERLSNDMGDIPEFSFYEPVATGYYPGLRYYNGMFFPTRDNFYNMYTERNYYDIEVVEDYERRIRDTIDYGYVTAFDGTHIDITKPEGIEYLGNLIQGNYDSVNTRFYGYFIAIAKTLLGGSYYDYHNYHYALPSAMEHFETSMRDPLFYQLYKRIIRFYWQFKNTLPCYRRDEIEFSGIKIQSVVMDKLITYFDRFDADITNAVDIEMFSDEYKPKTDYMNFGKVAHYKGEEFVIKARQYRLNHAPFTYTMNVYSDKAVTGVVRVYYGPKYDEFGREFTIHENRENFFMIDTFRYDFIIGSNAIIRDSKHFAYFVNDRTTYYNLYKWVMTATQGSTQFTLDMTEAHNGFPNRLMLPRGKKGGMPFTFFFIVSPYFATTPEQYTGFDHTYYSGVGTGAKYIDKFPFGYPFDRKIDESAWYTSNMFYYDANIFYKKDFDFTNANTKF